MVPTLIRRFYENRNNGSDLVIWGDGTPLREYTYSQDFARACIWCLENYDGAQVLNVGTTEELSIGDIALLIARYLGIDSKRLVYDSSKPRGVFRKSTDNSRFVTLSGFKYTPFSVALERTIQWFVQTMQRDPGLIRTASKRGPFPIRGRSCVESDGTGGRW